MANTKEIKQELEPECVREAILDNEEIRKIFISGIPVGTEDEKLKAFLEGICAGIVEIAVIKNNGVKKSHYGFATFETSEMVDEMLLKRDLLKFNKALLTVERAVPKRIKTPGWFGTFSVFQFFCFALAKLNNWVCPSASSLVRPQNLCIWI